MSRAPYTAFLGRVAGQSGGPLTLYTARSDVLTVVTSLTIVWGDVTVSGLDAWFQSADGTKLSRMTLAVGITPGSFVGGDHTVYARWALEYPDELLCQTSSGTADFYATGYELSIP